MRHRPGYANPSSLRLGVEAFCALGNRFVGSPGEAAARRYILDEFEASGLVNVRAEEFDVLAYRPGAAAATVEGPSGSWTLSDVAGLQFTAAGRCSATAVYLGQPRSVGDVEQMCKGGLELEGRVAVVDTYWPYALGDLLAERGCAGIVVVSPDPGGIVAQFTACFYPSQAGPQVLAIPGVTISRPEAQRLLSIMSTREVLLTLDHDAGYEVVQTANVIGEAPGTIRAEEYVVVGAHYDTQAAGVGACDNATGVVAMLHAAEWCTRNPADRTIVFAAFGDEEHGLNGSVNYCRSHVDRLDATAGMVCLDALGWLFPGQSLHVEPSLREFAVAAATECGWSPDVVDASLLIGSDHNAFIDAGVPACWFWHYPPQHPGYHSVGDTPDLLNFELVASAAEVSIHTALAMARANVLGEQRSQPTRRWQDLRPSASPRREPVL